MALTLLEAMKVALNDGKVKEAAIIKQYAESSGILEALAFRNITGNAISYNREETLPSVGFRGVNESYTDSVGILNPQTETLTICGGEIKVDKYLVQTMGADVRSAQEMMQVKAISLAWTDNFINGDSSTNPKEFDGLKRRLTGTQLISAGSTSGGDVLSLNKLDELIDTVESPTHLVMNKAMKRRLTAAGRNTSVGGYISYERDEFGRPLTMYADLPIVVLDENNTRDKILPFTEAGAGGGTAQSCSIYCVSMGEMMLQGIQNGGISVTDIGEMESSPHYLTRVEWYNGIMMMNGRAAARLYGVKDGAVTV
jgi:hypothetical protein